MQRKYKVPEFAVGDRVAYSVQFLKSIGMSHSVMAAARGTVAGIERPCDGWVLVQIDWSREDLPAMVNAGNLAKVGPNPRFCNVD